MRRITVTTSGVSDTAPVILDQYIAPFNVTVDIIVTGTVTYTVQYTTSDLLNGETATWKNSTDSNVVAATTSQTSNFVIPVTAIRVRQTAGSGSTVINILQAGIA